MMAAVTIAAGKETKNAQQFYPQRGFQFFIPEAIGVIIIFDLLHDGRSLTIQ
jgi:hypothetical protein